MTEQEARKLIANGPDCSLMVETIDRANRWNETTPSYKKSLRLLWNMLNVAVLLL